MSAKDKEILDRLHAKYYGKKKTPVQKVNEAIAKHGLPIKFVAAGAESGAESIVVATKMSRNELMLEAKNRGVKNFRVLNKSELEDALKNIGDQKRIDEIVAGAVARWKSGWGKEKKCDA